MDARTDGRIPAGPAGSARAGTITGWLVRSDVASGDTIHVRADAFCANVGY
jgi:hypothetical protein